MFKIRKVILWILGCLPLLAVIIMLPYLPDQIPAHYNFSGEVDRFGSKFELLIVPFITIFVLAIIGVLEFTLMRKNQTNLQNAKAIFAVELTVALFFSVITGILSYLAFARATNLADAKIDISKIVAVALSICWVIIGNILPKCKQNAFIGIRTSWTLANETVWYKTHRIGGLVMVSFGILSAVLCAAVFKGFIALIFSLGGFIVLTIPIIIYSYAIYKRELKK